MLRLTKSLLVVTFIFVILLQLLSAISDFTSLHQNDVLSDDSSINSRLKQTIKTK